MHKWQSPSGYHSSTNLIPFRVARGCSTPAKRSLRLRIFSVKKASRRSWCSIAPSMRRYAVPMRRQDYMVVSLEEARTRRTPIEWRVKIYTFRRLLACWGNVDLAKEQTIFGEVTVALPLLAGGYAHLKGSWRNPNERRFAELFMQPSTPKPKEYAAAVVK